MTLLESGAIVLHVATRFAGLRLVKEAARVPAVNWIFAAAGTVEPVIVDREASHGSCSGSRSWRIGVAVG